MVAFVANRSIRFDAENLWNATPLERVEGQ